MKKGPADCQWSSTCRGLTLPGRASESEGCRVHDGRIDVWGAQAQVIKFRVFSPQENLRTVKNKEVQLQLIYYYLINYYH